MSEEERDQMLSEHIKNLREWILLAQAQVTEANLCLREISRLGINTDVLKEKVLRAYDDLRRIGKDVGLD